MILQRNNQVASQLEAAMLVYVRDGVHRRQPPSFEEIARAHRCSVRSVIAAMRQLKKKGLITWDPLRERSFVLLEASQARLDLK